jgi:hypothetical protein
VRIVFSLLLIAVVGACVATTTLVIFDTTGAAGLCLHYGALRHAATCGDPPPAVWKSVVLLAPAAFLYILVAPKHWPLWAVLWFWPALFWIGAVRCAQLGIEHAGGFSYGLLAAAVGCVAAGFIPIVGWRWNVVPRDDPREAGEVLRGFLFGGIGALGFLGGLVYVSLVS